MARDVAGCGRLGLKTHYHFLLLFETSLLLSTDHLDQVHEPLLRRLGTVLMPVSCNLEIESVVIEPRCISFT